MDQCKREQFGKASLELEVPTFHLGFNTKGAVVTLAAEKGESIWRTN